MKIDDTVILSMLENIRQGEQEEFDDLYQKYLPLINAKVNEFSQSLEADEIKQIASIALYDAAMSYNPEKVDNKVTFGLYADICIRNRLISELRRTKTREVLNGDIMPLEKESDNGASSPEEFVLRKEDMLTRLRKAKSLLTPYESNVFFHYLSGESYEEIASALGKSKKSVDNALRRIRSKFKYNNMPE